VFRSNATNLGLNPKISLINLPMLNQNWVRLIEAQLQPLGGQHVIFFLMETLLLHNQGGFFHFLISFFVTKTIT